MLPDLMRARRAYEAVAAAGTAPENCLMSARADLHPGQSVLRCCIKPHGLSIPDADGFCEWCRDGVSVKGQPISPVPCEGFHFPFPMSQQTLGPVSGFWEDSINDLKRINNESTLRFSLERRYLQTFRK